MWILLRTLLIWSSVFSSVSLSVSLSGFADNIWIGKTDASIACENDKGVALNVMEKELKKSGIGVLARQKVYDDKMRIQMCGIDKGVMNGFLIHKKDVTAATARGFLILEPQPKATGKKMKKKELN